MNKLRTSDEPVCKLCSSRKTKLRRNTLRYGEKRDVRECEKCGLIFLWPIEVPGVKAAEFHKTEFRNLPRVRLGLVEHDPDLIFESRLGQAKRRFDRIEPHIHPEMTLLEIGCSAGSFLSVAKPYFRNCTAIELDPIFANYVREKCAVDVIEKPVEKMGKNAGPFDAICMWHVLEHLNKPVAVLEQLKNLLSDSGYLFVEVPNVWDPLHTLYHLKAFDDFYFQSPHLYYFSPKTLKAAFEKAGWVAKIFPVQVYGLANHIRWISLRRPQSNQPKGRISFINLPDKAYRWILSKIGRTDTLFTMARKQ